MRCELASGFTVLLLVFAGCSSNDPSATQTGGDTTTSTAGPTGGASGATGAATSGGGGSRADVDAATNHDPDASSSTGSGGGNSGSGGSNSSAAAGGSSAQGGGGGAVGSGGSGAGGQSGKGGSGGSNGVGIYCSKAGTGCLCAPQLQPSPDDVAFCTPTSVNGMCCGDPTFPTAGFCRCKNWACKEDSLGCECGQDSGGSAVRCFKTWPTCCANTVGTATSCFCDDLPGGCDSGFTQVANCDRATTHCTGGQTDLASCKE